jgi:hypothetical protein
LGGVAGYMQMYQFCMGLVAGQGLGSADVTKTQISCIVAGECLVWCR